ncbi:hypothetical protein FEM48_Zijuj04G0067800 [Ziziphus jujuba var. spinosa]|uniref:Uncharacterized protein n=1 Tax=Ziziphus jujuba var. spinosa TaxID=714518 RepID=A0A978VIE5_ZIZJJ|nr:hypothetical protein FEM48_Zijuj04G0067800 [Ziziphus jujuba var. spinosa]
MAQEYLKEYRRLTSNDDLQAPSVVKSNKKQNQYQQDPPTKPIHAVAEQTAEQKQQQHINISLQKREKYIVAAMAQEYLKEYVRLTSNDDLHSPPTVVKSYQNQNQYQRLPPTKLNHAVAEPPAEHKQFSRWCGREDEICPNRRKPKR